MTKKVWKFLTLVLIVIFTMIGGINLILIGGSKGRVFTQLTNLPRRDYGLVMGTDLLRFDGSTNVHFLNRTEGAAKVYLSGKVNRLLISGNKNNDGFNEVLGIRNELLAKGIPDGAMILDFDGFTTWESALHAREKYHLQKVMIVTDSFHAPRAIFLCRHLGIDAVAFCYGNEPFGFWSMRYQVREWLARVKAFFEVLAYRRRS